MPVLVVRLGQSNSFGAAAMATLQGTYQQTYANIQRWTGSAFASLNYAVNNNQYPAPLTNCFGAEFSFLSQLQPLVGSTIYDVSYGISGSVLGTATNATVNWNINTRGSYYDNAISTINAAVEYMWNTLMLRSDYKIFVVWVQGEADAQNTTDKNNYQTNLQAFVNAIRAMFGSCATPYFFIAEINQNTFQINATSRAVTAASNATPIRITTAAAHALTTNQFVTIQNVGGNTAANGNFQVTVINSTQFDLQGSVGNGAYTSGGNINSIYWKADIQTAQQAVAAATSRTYSYNTDSFPLQADGVHRNATGYEDEGDACLNIVTTNNLLS